MPSLVRLMGTFLIIALLIPCTTSCTLWSYRRAMMEARSAENQGDEKDALVAYRRACELRGSEESCDKAEELTESLARKAVATAEDYCLEGRVDQCDEVMREVAGPASGHPSIIMALEDAMEAAVKWDERAIAAVDSCIPDETPDIETSLRTLSCLKDAMTSALDRPAFHDGVAEHRSAIAEPFRSLTEDAPIGARFLLARAVDWIVSGGEARTRTERAKSAFVSSRSRPLEVELRWDGPSAVPQPLQNLCSQIESRLLGLSCSGADDLEPVSLVISLTKKKPRYTINDQHRSERYQSGVRRERNEEHFSLIERLAVAERTAAESESTYQDWKAACDSARRQHRSAGNCTDCEEKDTRDYNCDRADMAEDTHERHSREAERIRRSLNRTPSFIERPVYDVHTYVERHHLWTVNYSFVIDSPLLDERLNSSGQFRWRSEERPGFEPAGIEEKSLEHPPAEFFSTRIARAARLGLEAQALKARSVGQPDPAEHCDSEDLVEWLACHAQAALAVGDLISADELMGLVMSRVGVDDPILQPR